MVLGGVTRFGEFSPFWQNYKNWQFLQVLGNFMNLWQFLEGLFSIWEKIKLQKSFAELVPGIDEKI